MYEYYVSNELARLTIIIGIVVSTIIYKRTGLTLGGVIVCGYLALFIGRPRRSRMVIWVAFLSAASLLQARARASGLMRFPF